MKVNLKLNEEINRMKKIMGLNEGMYVDDKGNLGGMDDDEPTEEEKNKFKMDLIRAFHANNMVIYSFISEYNNMESWQKDICSDFFTTSWAFEYYPGLLNSSLARDMAKQGETFEEAITDWAENAHTTPNFRKSSYDPERGYFVVFPFSKELMEAMLPKQQLLVFQVLNLTGERYSVTSDLFDNLSSIAREFIRNNTDAFIYNLSYTRGQFLNEDDEEYDF